MEKEIIGYKIRDFKKEDVIPVNAIYLTVRQESMFVCERVFTNTFYVFMVPAYKAKIKKK